MGYESLQSYLEAHLKVATNISPELIEQLKQEWRKDYVARYNKQYRENHVQITFRLSKKRYKKLLSIAEQHQQKPTVYCRRLVIDAIGGNRPQDVQPLRLLLMELIDMVEEAQYERKSLDTEDILLQLQKMHNELL